MFFSSFLLEEWVKPEASKRVLYKTRGQGADRCGNPRGGSFSQFAPEKNRSSILERMVYSKHHFEKGELLNFQGVVE